MRNRALGMTVLSLLILSGAGGCAHTGGVTSEEVATAEGGTGATVTEIASPSEGFSGYDVLVIQPFANDRPAVVPRHLPNLVAARVREVAVEKRLFNYQVFIEGGRTPVRPGRRLVLGGSIVDYEEGNRLKRAAALGGAAKVTARYHFTDGPSGEIIATGTATGILATSLDLGGEPDEAVDLLATGLVAYIQRHL